MPDYLNGIPGAPQAIGPYSQAVSDGNYVFLSGQVPSDPSTGELIEGSIEAQTERVLKNLSAVLHGAGCEVSDILKATIFLTDLGNFSVVNQVYADWLGDARPARATVQVSALPLGAEVEIELTARRPDQRLGTD